MRSTKETDSGKYVNGVYTTKNGYTNSGLNCPKGTRLYNTEVKKPIFFMPEDRGETEDFELLTEEVAPDVMPYYAISNYGRLMNIYSGKVMKKNYRPNGYGYYCLAAKNSKTGQKKYNCNRLVMKTFEPREDMDMLEVNHINGIKSDDYINKTMPDGSVRDNLEWCTRSDNTSHAHTMGLNRRKSTFGKEEVADIRNLRSQGYSFGKINEIYPTVGYATIQAICLNRIYVDPNYIPPDVSPYENIECTHLKVSDKDAENIRELSAKGFTHKEIVERFYPNISASTVSDIVRGISHNR